MSDDKKVSKGLEFPVVALPGVGHMRTKGEDEQEAARVFYVAATRATQRLVIKVSGDGGSARGLDAFPPNLKKVCNTVCSGTRQGKTNGK